jgi:hypothetical protein
MDANIQVALSIAVPTLAVLVGILINNSRLSDLRSQIDARFDFMIKYMDARFNEFRGHSIGGAR